MGHEEPSADHPAQCLGVEVEIVLAYEPQRVAVHDRGIRSDHLAVTETREPQALEEFVPVVEVEHELLSLLQLLELTFPEFGTDLACVEILPPQNAVDVLQPGPAERQGHPDPQQLVRTGFFQIRITRAEVGWARLDRGTAERLQFPPPLLPVHRHQGEDEVGLVQLNGFRVYSHEYLGHLLFIGIELDDLETEFPQAPDLVDPFLQPLAITVAQRPAAQFLVAVHEPTDDALVTLFPELGDVRDEFRVVLDSRVGDHKGLVLGTEADANPFALIGLREHRL